MDISVILPTRERTDLLWDLIYNLHQKTVDFANIEMIIGYDHDDKKTKEFLLDEEYKKDVLKKEFGENLIEVRTVEFSFAGKENIHKHFNILGDEARSDKWIWLCGDDFRVLTDKWDQVLKEHAPSKKALISQGMFNNIPGYWAFGKRNDLNTYVAIAPIVTTDLYNAVVNLMLPPLDQWLWQLNDRVKILHTMDKVLDVEHRAWGAKKGEPGCSTLLQKFMKKESWKKSLDQAAEIIKKLQD